MKSVITAVEAQKAATRKEFVHVLLCYSHYFQKTSKSGQSDSKSLFFADQIQLLSILTNGNVFEIFLFFFVIDVL